MPDPLADHLVTPQNAALLLGAAEIDWGQPGHSSYDRTHAEL
jgi:hypothetical protein